MPRLLLLNQIDAADSAVVVFVADEDSDADNTFTLTRGTGDGSVAHCTAPDSGPDSAPTLAPTVTQVLVSGRRLPALIRPRVFP